MKTIASLERKLAELRNELETCVDPDTKASLEERIDFIQDEVDELEDANREQEEYWESTGTHPRDLYSERNSYAVRQGEMIEQFRSEI